MSDQDKERPLGQIVVYQQDDDTGIRVLLEGDTAWLTQRLLADLYQIGVNTVNHHVKSIYDDGELSEEATIRQYRIVQTEGSRKVERLVDHYNLEMIIAIGYRVLGDRLNPTLQYGIRLNPKKSEPLTLTEEDQIVVLARERARQSGAGNKSSF